MDSLSESFYFSQPVHLLGGQTNNVEQDMMLLPESAFGNFAEQDEDE